MRVRGHALAVVALLVLSGCASKDEGQPAQASAAGVAANLQAGPAGTLQGLIVDDEEVPVAKAMVGIKELQRWTTVGEGGRFTLDGVPYGEYEVLALALGFETAVQTVPVREGTAGEQVILRLVPVPTIEAYHETQTWVASLDYPSTSGANNGNYFFRIPGEGLRRLVYEADWVSQPGGQNLQWNLRDEVQGCNCGPERYAYWAGPSPLQFELFPGNYHEAGDLPFNGAKGFGYRVNWRHLPYDVTNPSFVQNVSVVVDQKINNYLTFFYWEMGDRTFTALREE